MLTIHPGIESTKGTFAEYFVLPMCIGLLTVGAAPMYTSERFKKWHATGAILAALFSQLVVFSHGMILYSLVIIATCYIIQVLTTKKDTVLWLEIGCFISYFISTHANL